MIAAPITPAVMAEMLLNRRIKPKTVATDEAMARHIALALVEARIRCLQAPEDYEAVRACLERLWADPEASPVEVAA